MDLIRIELEPALIVERHSDTTTKLPVKTTAPSSPLRALETSGADEQVAVGELQDRDAARAEIPCAFRQRILVRPVRSRYASCASASVTRGEVVKPFRDSGNAVVRGSHVGRWPSTARRA